MSLHVGHITLGILQQDLHVPCEELLTSGIRMESRVIKIQAAARTELYNSICIEYQLHSCLYSNDNYRQTQVYLYNAL